MTRVYGARDVHARPQLIGGAGVALPDPASSVDMRARCTYVDDQIGSQCVGEAVSGAHFLATNGAGKRASHRGIYTAARVRERSRKSDPVLDQGCIPADAFDALVLTGVYPLDDRDADGGALNSMETWDEAIGCKKFDPTDLTPITSGDDVTVDRWLTAGFPVVQWFELDQAFQDLSASGSWPGVTGPIIGGHCTVLVGFFNGGDYMLWNSWGRGWADGGFGRISRRVITSGAAGLVAVHGGPVLT